MLRGGPHMKCLKIEGGKGHFSINGADWLPIDQINKDHLFTLLDLAIEQDEFEIDEFNAETLANQAHQIIYRNIYEKFTEVRRNRSRFKDESAALYKDAIEKYSQ